MPQQARSSAPSKPANARARHSRTSTQVEEARSTAPRTATVDALVSSMALPSTVAAFSNACKASWRSSSLEKAEGSSSWSISAAAASSQSSGHSSEKVIVCGARTQRSEGEHGKAGWRMIFCLLPIGSNGLPSSDPRSVLHKGRSIDVTSCEEEKNVRGMYVDPTSTGVPLARQFRRLDGDCNDFGRRINMRVMIGRPRASSVRASRRYRVSCHRCYKTSCLSTM